MGTDFKSVVTLYSELLLERSDTNQVDLAEQASPSLLGSRTAEHVMDNKGYTQGCGFRNSLLSESKCPIHHTELKIDEKEDVEEEADEQPSHLQQSTTTLPSDQDMCTNSAKVNPPNLADYIYAFQEQYHKAPQSVNQYRASTDLFESDSIQSEVIEEGSLTTLPSLNQDRPTWLSIEDSAETEHTQSNLVEKGAERRSVHDLMPTNQDVCTTSAKEKSPDQSDYIRVPLEHLCKTLPSVNQYTTGSNSSEMKSMQGQMFGQVFHSTLPSLNCNMPPTVTIANLSETDYIQSDLFEREPATESSYNQQRQLPILVFSMQKTRNFADSTSCDGYMYQHFHDSHDHHCFDEDDEFQSYT